MSKSTVVSIVPFEVIANKITLHPGDFRVPKSDGKNPEVLVVGDSYYDVYLGTDRTPSSLKITATSVEIARAIVEDFLGSLIATAPDAHPGIFWKEGEFSKEKATKEFQLELIEAKKVQHNWFINLVKMADDDWSKSNHRHTAISDLQRYACKELGMEREWLFKVVDTVNMRDCPVCTLQISNKALKCPHCGVILDKKKYEEYSFA